MKPSFVIDASVIISWFAPEENDDYAGKVLSCLDGENAATSKLCCLEVLNVFRQFEKKNRVSSTDIERALTYIETLPIAIDRFDWRFNMPHILVLAREHGLSIYDACYLEISVRTNLPLATLDRKLAEAAQNMGVGLKVFL